MLRVTPFHSRTAALNLGQAWRRWAGYLVASAYELQHDREYHAIRCAAALLDVSPLYKYLITGPDAVRLLDRVVTRDVARAVPGQVLYTPWCDERGKQIDDGTVARLGDVAFRLTSAEPNLRWLHLNASGLRVVLADESDTVAALAVQGPASREILERAADTDLSGLKFFRLVRATVRGIPVTLSRTGYTGDLGYEIWADARDALPLWDALVETGTPYGLTPAGMLALDLARIEAGLILLDVDYVPATRAVIEDQKSSPLELNLGWTVALEKPFFVGREALAAEASRGPSWRLVGVEVDWVSLERLYAAVGLPPKLPTTAWRVSVPLYVDGQQVGYATSGCWSPLLKRYIALAHVEARYASPGTEVWMEVTVEHRRRQAAARIVSTPFYSPARKRASP
ncbi:MAG TPA: aminomethyltransferase family protein [Gemmatimonadales bacterium]|nr:aminomethyltransferase family protein [Gemmatimonadales bacterium]